MCRTFVGQAVMHREATQWIVSRETLSNGMLLSSHEEMCSQNDRVNAFMHSDGLVHMGWQRVVSDGDPLTMSDIHKHKVCASRGYSLRCRVLLKCAIF
jgi:uncharacterized protein YfiM (DUF2279 family)